MRKQIFNILSVLFASATLISIISNGFDLQMAEFSTKILRQYDFIRDLLFLPLSWLAKLIGWNFTWWVKDTIVIWLLFGGINLRFVISIDEEAARDLEEHPLTTWLIAAIFGPLHHIALFVHAIQNMSSRPSDAEFSKEIREMSKVTALVIFWVSFFFVLNAYGLTALVS